MFTWPRCKVSMLISMDYVQIPLFILRYFGFDKALIDRASLSIIDNTSINVLEINSNFQFAY